MIEHGDVWVGFTDKAYSVDMGPHAGYNLGGIPALKAYDPVRYGPLYLTPDPRPHLPAPPPTTPPQSLDLLTQVAALFKSNDPSSPLRGFKVRKLYAVGNGMNGEVLGGYIRTGQDRAWRLANGGQLIDGYMYDNITRMPPKPPKNAAFIMIRSEFEMERGAFQGFIGHDANTASYRVYDVPGLTHLGTRDLPENAAGFHQLAAVLPDPKADMPFAVDPTRCPNMNDEPSDLLLGALLTRMELWGKNGTPLPAAPLPALLPGDPNAPMGNPTSAGPMNIPQKVAIIKRDPISGNVIGGVRMPWVAAPIAMYPATVLFPSSEATTIPFANGTFTTPADSWPRAIKDKAANAVVQMGGNCALMNQRLPYTTAGLKTLYKNYADYLRKFDAAKAAAVKAGWLLKDDADTLRPRGDPANF